MSAQQHDTGLEHQVRPHLHLVEPLSGTALAETVNFQSDIEDDGSIVSELETKDSPVAKLTLVVNNFDQLGAEVDSPTDYIDTMSRDTLEWLELLDQQALKKARGDSNKLIRPALGFSQILTCMYAWELHPNDDTEQLARLAMDHATYADEKKSFYKAFNTVASDSSWTIDEALEAAATYYTEQNPSSYQHEFPWLFSASVPAPSNMQYSPAGNKAVVDPETRFN